MSLRSSHIVRPLILSHAQPWITPSLFASKPEWVVDELTYAAYWYGNNATAGQAEISAHWDGWISYPDLQDIKRLGLNTVRIPVGCGFSRLGRIVSRLTRCEADWSLVPLLEGETFMVGAFGYLRRLVAWAGQIGLQVVRALRSVLEESG